jgi:hypothetical protein
MLDARFKALPKWNRQPGLQGVSAHFKTAYNRTLDKMEYELRKLDARDVVIEAGYRLDQIRNDGWPRGGCAPSHPGVVLYFKSADGPLCFPCGNYSRMEDNIHAIALTLENLRAIDRYGVTLQHQQYLGFAALPAPATTGTVEQAAQFFASIAAAGITAEQVMADPEIYRKVYRYAAAQLHPDAGGDRGAWTAMQNAAVLLEEHHKGVLAK